MTPLAACVFGTHEPSTESTTYMNVALPVPCTACTWTMALQESVFTVAELFGNDWLSVWSLNTGNPDKDQSGTSIYYAHPYMLLEVCVDSHHMLSFRFVALRADAVW